MHRIINTNPNSSNNVNGVEFEHDSEGRLVSVNPVGGEALEIFLAVPGFLVLDDSPAKQPEAAAEKAQPEQSADAPAGEVAAAAAADTAAADTGDVSQPAGEAAAEQVAEQVAEQSGEQAEKQPRKGSAKK